ncbi:MAG: HIT domain-containing protein [Alphaproteobacteria bacterium]|nr:HIT domain-containing protein [Alphaproteobacteria bacterium]
MAFVLDPQLVVDTVPLGEFALSGVHLMNERRYPWLVLVPKRAGARELIDLTPSEQMALVGEIDRVCRAIKPLFNPDKLNVATIGNVVAQLHIHIVGRYRIDPAWPKPVWGASSRLPYEADSLARRVAELRAALQLT